MIARILHIVARLLSALLIAVFMLFVLSEGIPDPYISMQENVAFVIVFAGLVGLLMAWRKPLAGGLIAVGAWFLLAILDSAMGGSGTGPMGLIAVNGGLFLAAHIIGGRRSGER